MNSNTLKTLVPVAALLCVCFATAFAQRAAETNSGMIGNEQINGHLFFPRGDDHSVRPIIKLQSLSSPEITAITDQDGNFRFTHLRPDAYTVVVEGGDRYEKATETVLIGNSGSVPAQGDPGSYAIPIVYQVQIYLRPKGSGPANNRAFSDVPVNARELFSQALESSRKGDHKTAIEQLQLVISEAPKFTPAYNELAVELMKTNEPAKAIGVLTEALKINPDDFSLLLNHGIALLIQKRFAEAETELRTATQKNKTTSPVAPYYLSIALVNEHKFDEALPLLEQVIKNGGQKLALAHKYLGGIYWRNKHYREAADELETFLKLDPKASDAEKIQSTIKDLREKN